MVEAILPEYGRLLFGGGEETGLEATGQALRRDFTSAEVDAVLAEKGRFDHWPTLNFAGAKNWVSFLRIIWGAMEVGFGIAKLSTGGFRAGRGFFKLGVQDGARAERTRDVTRLCRHRLVLLLFVFLSGKG